MHARSPLGNREQNELSERVQQIWTPETVERACQLWRDGRSASFIAGELGLTRNAVMGKLARLGLLGPARTAALQPVAPPRPKPQPEPHVPPPPPPVPPPVVPPPVAQPPKPVSFMRLSSCHCRFPLGEERPFRYCGAPPEAGSSYCPEHTKACYYRPPSPVRSPRRR